MSGQNQEKSFLDGVSRRSFLGVGSAALVAGAMAGITAHAQQRENTASAERNRVIQDPRITNFSARTRIATHLLRRTTVTLGRSGTPLTSRVNVLKRAVGPTR